MPATESRRDVSLESAAIDLVRTLNPKKSDRDHRRLVSQFLSSLRSHSLLPPHERDVQAAFEGVCRKLEFHSRDEEAEKLRNLKGQLMDVGQIRRGQESLKESEKTFRWRVLSFLLKMANRPSAPGLAQPSPSYYRGSMSRAPFFTGPFASPAPFMSGRESLDASRRFIAPDVAALEEAELREAVAELRQIAHLKLGVRRYSEDSSDDEEDVPDGQESSSAGEAESKAPTEMELNGFRKFSSIQEIPPSALSAAALPSPPDPAAHRVIIQHILWNLACDEPIIIPDHRSPLPHGITDWRCIRSLYATEFCPLSAAMKSVRASLTLIDAEEAAKQPRSLTLVALSDEVRSALTETRDAILELEKDLNAPGNAEGAEFFVSLLQESGNSLRPIRERLETLSHVLSAVRYILENSISDERTPSSEAWRVLSRLYELSYTSPPESDVAKRLFSAAVQPFLEIVRRWIDSGVFQDPTDEFIITLRQDVPRDTVEFFRTGFWIRARPEFMGETLDSLLDCGRSLFVLKESSGDLSDIAFPISAETVEKKAPPVVRSPDVDSEEMRRFLSSTKQELDKDPYLRIAFEVPDAIPYNGAQGKSSSGDRQPRRTLVTGPDDLHDALHQPILQLKPKIQTRLIGHFRDSLQLLKWLSAVQDVFLFSENMVMKEFLHTAHKTSKWPLIHPGTWATSFHDCLNAKLDKNIASFFSLGVVDDGDRPRPFVQLLDTLQLRFQPSWPLSLVLPKERIDGHRMLFAFLLRIKLSLLILSQLDFEDMNSDEGVFIKRLQLLRFWTSHLAEHINFFVTTELQSLGYELFSATEECKTLQDVIQLHEDFVAACCRRTLFDLKPVRSRFLYLLTLALNIRDLWWNGFGTDADFAELQRLESSYIQLHRLLVLVLEAAFRDPHYDSAQGLFLILQESKPEQLGDLD